jgi:glucose/arabinose dehydrogenase
MTAGKTNKAQKLIGLLIAGSLLSLVVGCGDNAKFNILDGTGPEPVLPDADTPTITTVNIAPAIGWPAGQLPVSTAGTDVAAFASGLDHPRWLYVLPNGDVLVSETNGPATPNDGKGIQGWIMKKVMTRAGAGVPSANRITLLRDTDGDGIADFQSVLLADLHSPFGMTLVHGYLYVANTDAIVRFAYTDGVTAIKTSAEKVIDLPAGEINHHWTKNIIASPDGTKLYATVGSNSNVAERGMEAEDGRAAIWELDIATGDHRMFAFGLRNPNGLAWEPTSNTLWTVVNERDDIGGDLVPDYLTSVVDGRFYGWPYSYFGQHVDQRVTPKNPELVARAVKPDYALGSHTASLGLVESTGTSLPAIFSNGMFIGQHGSWNRKPASGYKVVFVPFKEGEPIGMPIDVLSGFLSKDGEAYGRPVGVAIDKTGALLVADDVGNIIWRVTSSQ